MATTLEPAGHAIAEQIVEESYHVPLLVPASTSAPPSVFKTTVKSLLSGAVGGALIVAASSPFDIVKVRLQTFYRPTPADVIPNAAATATAAAASANAAVAAPLLQAHTTPAAAGPRVTAMLSEIWRHDGFTGFYRGAVPVLAGIVPIMALTMASYRAALTAIDPTPPDAAAIAIPPLYHGYAGFLATLPVTLVVAPAERVKILLQIQRGATSPPLGAVLRTLWMPPPQPSRTPARSPLATWLDVARFGGRGFGWTLARDGIGNFCYFATYEAMRTRLIPPPPPPPASTREGAPEPLGQRMRREGFGILMSGALAGIACWTVCLPFDTIKSRVQTSLARDPTDVALARVLQQLRAEGSVLKGLYRGLTPTLLRAFPASAAFFLGMETAKTGLDYLWP